MKAMAERRDVEAATPAPSDEAVLLTEIRDLLTSGSAGSRRPRGLVSSSGSIPSRPT